ncbi:MAG TPA: hypothetical protein VFP63_06765 [Dehalococcoidia bacterium]|nr:hypothetical protein [Dehalococcoidia bacterium]
MPLVSAASFFILFLGAAVLLGDILGSFGDPDEVFIEHYAGSSERIGDIAGSVLLAAAGGVFVWHVELVRRAFVAGHEAGPDVPLLASVIFATTLLVAASALATVPLGREIGDLFDERRPRLEGAETSVLAHFGYVLLFGAGGVIGAICLFSTSLALRATAAPGWLIWTGFVAAALLPLSPVAFIPFLALPVWVAVSGVAASRFRKR